MIRRIKHNKIKNSWILFETLARQVTSDVLDEKSSSISSKILKEYFNKNTELRKELELYKVLIEQKYNSEARASSFIDLIVEQRKQLNNDILRREKYNIIKKIKDNFDVNTFFTCKIDNYAVIASVYKLFEYNNISESKNPDDLIKAKFTIVDHITSNNTSNNKLSNEQRLLENFKSQHSDIKILTNRILIDKFNEKYSEKLNGDQKKLVREYINNISSTNTFREYVLVQLPIIAETINNLNISDQAIKIKLTEVINQLNKIKKYKTIKDNHVVVLMKVYELIDEIKKHNCEQSKKKVI